ncbi:Nif3-like dinuclear metal center hexameric protein [uncultured Corynebacterium sp.]|uniref:Nif3-like dinuclear metal center hexameric protein n=1 Tax=uncultured Corynebacterium sp. TaxID=159447 RepID=UPI0025EFF5C0|nr:Nif3-like dinuclear metal center hexameric protein [uncultured Corynebacterium sp.]
MITVADIRQTMDAAFPPALAEEWDRVGLICGDPSANVSRVAVALEATDAVVDHAIDQGADMLIVHHPLLLRGTHSVATDDPKGRLLHRLIKHDCALFAAHTNADAAHGGVNDILADLLGVTETTPLDPIKTTLHKWGVMVPVDHVEKVKDAVFAEGAGKIGQYSRCSFESEGKGQFLPEDGSHPALGNVGTIEHATEVRVEFVARPSLDDDIIDAIGRAHPYEEPAFDCVTMSGGVLGGIGRVGKLASPTTLKEFTQRVADALPETVEGIRAAGDPDTRIETVALCSGAGDSFLDQARAVGADVYVTSDLRHHPADEHLRRGKPVLVDTAHWASEFPWCGSVATMMREQLDLPAEVIEVRTDPWTVHAIKKR